MSEVDALMAIARRLEWIAADVNHLTFAIITIGLLLYSSTHRK